MFCFQCEQTAKGEGCTKVGVCGKQPEVAALQDLLIYAVKGLSRVAVEGRKVGVDDSKIDHFACEAIFSTLTNVDFDPDRLVALINEAVRLRDELKEKVKAAGGNTDFQEGAANFIPESTKEAMIHQGEQVGVKSDPAMDPDILSLRELLVYGIKGVASYADHAAILGQADEAVYAFIHEAMAATLDKGLTLDDYLGLVMKCGEVNLKVMELLDAANTGTYGHPVPTEVPLGAKAGKAILVSGHDLRDLEMILKQTEGKGINVYTHGEMLPCHGYPELKKYPHFYGHYGTAWQNQAKEFDAFPGAIVMTTNCIQKPRESYHDRIFTTGLVGWPNVRHIADKDFTPAIEKALALHLAKQGKKVTIVGREKSAGFDINPSFKWRYMIYLRQNGVKAYNDYNIDEIGEGEIIIKTYDGYRLPVKCDTIVVTEREANSSLKNVVQGEGIELFVIGDALVPRNLSSAVHDGYRIGMRI